MQNENYKAVSPSADENHLTGAMDDEDAEAKERLTSNDPTKVKFISANSNFGRKNGEAKVDIENVQRTVGMGKEELMKYANEPFWVRLRMALFVLFWLVWVAMLVGSVVIIIFAPRCPPAPRLDWWQKTVVYQLNVNAFKDGNKDGLGDLQGLTSKLDYFKDLGVDALLLSPFYPSESADNGNDIIDYTGIHSDYGDMQAFDDLVAAMKSRGQKLILDFVPNHSGDKHPWFEKSVKREAPYTDYYIWADPKPGTVDSPPNNWASVYGGPAWTFHPVRKQFYLHQFFATQPDLNLRNSNVREEMMKILLFWLNKGVDGFRVDSASYLFENVGQPDEPPAKNVNASKSEYDHLDHIYTKHQQETMEILNEWRELMNNFSSSGSHRVLIAQFNENVNDTMFYNGNGSHPIIDMPLNTALLKLDLGMMGHSIYDAMLSWIAVSPDDLWPNWVLGNEDLSRLATRVGPEMVDAIHMTTLLAKGTPVVYYGDELGMEDVKINEGDARDRLHRDKARTPMQWDNSSSGGFTNSSHPWLPLSDNTSKANVQNELEDSRSHLNIFRSLVRLRNQASICFGLMEFPVVTDELFSMMRVRKGSPGYLVVVNTGANATVVDFSSKNKLLPESARVELASKGTEEGHLSHQGNPKVELKHLDLGPRQSAVLTFVPKFD